MFTVGESTNYYAVDHSPSYLWNSATWEISSAVLPFLPAVMAGPAGWEANETVRRAIEVRALGSDVPGADVLVSTIPASAQTEAVGLVQGAGAVFDVVYDPWPTPLALAAADAGAVVVSGLDLLVHQALLQVELMTGSTVSLDLLRVAGERALTAR